MKKSLYLILYSLSLLGATWFAVMGMVWVYWAALFIAYPIGILSLLIWLNIKKEPHAKDKYIPIILILGVILSLLSLLYLLIWD